MSDPPLIDRAMLDDLFDSIGADGTRSVLELFIGETAKYIATIAEAAAEPQDAVRRERARRAAHSLKSGAGQIGAAALAATAGEVERAAGAGDMPGLAEAAQVLQGCGAETLAALRELVDQR